MMKMRERKRLNNEKKYKGFFRTMLPYMAGSKKNIIIAMICSVITGACLALQPLMIKYIVDDGIGAASPGDPWLFSFLAGLFGSDGTVTQTLQIQIVLTLSCAYVVLALLRTSCWGFGVYHILNALEDTLFAIRSRFFNHIQHMCMRFYDKSSSGDLFNCIMGSPMANIRAFLNQLTMTLPYQLVSFAISMVALLSYDWRLTLILLLTAIAMALLRRFSRNKIRRVSREYLTVESQASQYITDMLHGADAVKIYAMEDIAVENFDKRLAEMKRAGVKSSFTNSLEYLKPEFTQYLGIAVVYAVGGIYCITSGLTVGVLYAFLSSMTSILGIISSWLSIGVQKTAAEVALDKIRTVMEENTTTPELPVGETRSIEVERRSALATGKPCISFKDVTFAYDNRPIFSHFNCDIRHGESVGLVGSSGSGKSTFTRLAMRLYEISGGEILLYGKNIKSYPIHEMRLSFGVVPQSPFIFRGTLWDNIRIARPDAENYDIIQAMEVAHVHEFVNQLPMGWATEIGDGAMNLSGGQKQRIAIARAVLKNPDILIFDEATSALDNISERHIQEALEGLMKDHTVLMVAHRLSTVRNVDRILVFDQGKIVQEGRFDELARVPGLFREMLESASTEEKE